VRRRRGGVVLRPRGPRSCPSYAVSNPHHLIDPIRPTREHIAISPHGGLYANAFAVQERQSDPRVGNNRRHANVSSMRKSIARVLGPGDEQSAVRTMPNRFSIANCRA
jgi:hypothetical protein